MTMHWRESESEQTIKNGKNMTMSLPKTFGKIKFYIKAGRIHPPMASPNAYARQKTTRVSF